jgi:hypothetical protein
MEFAEFGQQVVEIRDEAIRTLDALHDGTFRDVTGERWSRLDQMQLREAIRMVIVDSVDIAMTTLLRRVDAAEFDIRWRADVSSEFVDPTEDGFGESEGWYFGEEGWLERFASQRLYP